MPALKLGAATPSAIYLGSTAVSKIYLGATEIWPLSDGATLTVSVGSFTLTGVNATFLRALKMAAGAGSFDLTGNVAGLSTGIPDLVAARGTFTLTGNAAALSRALRMSAVAGTFGLTGNDIALSKTVSLLAGSGSLVLSGVDAGFTRALVVAAAQASYTLTGSAATLTYSASGATDPYFANVVLLAHFDGTDGATSATDFSNSAHALTFNGNAQIDTVQSKYGGASLALDGTGDYVSVPDDANLRFGSGNFTIEFFVQLHTGISGSFPLAKWQTTGNQREWAVQFSAPSATSGQILFQYSTNGSNFPDVRYAVGVDGTLSIGTWYHFAIDYDGSNLRIYQDGVIKAKGALSGALFGSTAPLAIGARSVPDFYLDGWLDEVRLTKGVARYASDAGFTVPTEAYPDS